MASFGFLNFLIAGALFLDSECADTLKSFHAEFDSTSSLNKQWNTNQVHIHPASPVMELIPEDSSYKTAFVKDSTLHLSCQANKMTYREFEAYVGRCGRVDTKTKFKFKYGAVEWKAKFSPDEGSDYLLLVPTVCNSPNSTEPYVPGVCLGPRGSVLDQIIGFHLSRRGISAGTFFSHETTKTGEGYQVSGQGLEPKKQLNASSDFNTYGLIWSPKRCEWFINGESVRVTLDLNKIPSTELHIAIESYDTETFRRGDDTRPGAQKDLCVSSVKVRELTDEETASTSATKSTWTWS